MVKVIIKAVETETLIFYKNWSRQQLSHETGISNITLSRILNGTPCSIRTGLKMAKALDVDINEIATMIDESGIPKWIPIDEKLPDIDSEGYSEYILLSFLNATSLCIGQYREDDEGGAFYAGDDDDSLTSIGLHVNAWMPLPQPYRGEDDE